MKDQTKYTPYYQGEPSDRDKDKNKDYTPPPPPPACPNPCDERPPWGPPDIRPECCAPEDRACCPEEDHYCTWYEVDDPCVRAASCGYPWTRIECNCTSTNKDCDCEKWDCRCYPQATCVPCDPCDELLPNGPDEETDGSSDDGCADDLRNQLNTVRKDITAQQNQKAQIEAKIKADLDREKELAKLVEDFTALKDKYQSERPKLICREDCLKGFHRDITRVFADSQTFPYGCLEDFRDAINKDLCELEKARCCQKNLEGKLQTVTKLVWEDQQAENSLKKAEDAFKSIKDFPKWVGDQFTPLEALKDQITQALNDKDPLMQRWAFYLFYWKFVPGLCKRFPIAICCGEKCEGEQKEGDESQTATEDSMLYIGCKPGDWHPSVITVDMLAELICCAAEKVRCAKQESQIKKNEFEKTKANLEFIKKKVETDAKALEDVIKSNLNKVECKPASKSQ